MRRGRGRPGATRRRWRAWSRAPTPSLHVAAVYRTAGHPDSTTARSTSAGPSGCWRPPRARACARFVHTSTVGVHGHVENPPADETAPFAPGDIYQETKAEAEALALRFGRERGLPVAVVRPGAIYGPGETRLLKLFRAIARGRYAVVGSGRPFYHPVYIDDLVAGLPAGARASASAVGEAFIIAGPRYVSQDELARADRARTGGRVLPFHVPAAPLQLGGRARAKRSAFRSASSRRCTGGASSSGRRAARSRSRRRAALLGYAPKVDLEEGIARTRRLVPARRAGCERAPRARRARGAGRRARAGARWRSTCPRSSPRQLLGRRRDVLRDGLEPGRGRRPALRGARRVARAARVPRAARRASS